MKKFARRLLGLAQIPLWFLLALVPKDRARWVFGAWNGRRYTDNARYVFEEVRQNHPEIRPVWIAKNKALLQEMRAKGLPVAYAYSPRGLWAQVRASVAVFSHSVEWDLVTTCIAGRCLRIQGWHGIPIKKIGYLDEKGVSRRRAATITRLYPHRTDRCDLIFAAGDYDQAVFREAFNVSPDNVVQTGYPRNDTLFRLFRAQPHAPKHFIYLPTLRGGAGQVFDLFARSGIDLKSFDTSLGAAGLQLSIKLHPAQAMDPQDKSALDGCTNIALLPAAYDLNAVLPEVDALITDVSSVYFDFLYLDRPIILAQLDMATFERETRSLLTPLQDFDLGHSAASWEGVLARMQALNAAGPFVPDETYRRTKARFFTTVDDTSAARAVAEIRRRQSAAQHRAE